jgi:hypothetical protein
MRFGRRGRSSCEGPSNNWMKLTKPALARMEAGFAAYPGVRCSLHFMPTNMKQTYETRKRQHWRGFAPPFHNLPFMEHWRWHGIVTNNDAGFRHRHIWRNQLPSLGRRQQRAQSRLIVLRNTSGNRLPARGHEPSPINPAIQSMKRAAVSIAAAARSAETSEPGPSS